MRMAAEFSFFLAVPTMLAVTGYSIFLKDWEIMGVSGLTEVKGYTMLLEDKELLFLFLIGNLIAFIVAILAIKFFIGILKKYGFKMWGWYRIFLGFSFIVYYSFFA
jgi:undecaprenyl-diphosphatase